MLGASVSGLLGDVDMPDLDVDVDMDVDIDVDLDVDSDIGVAAKFLYWLKIGKVPLLILIVIFLTLFALCGYVLQFLFLSLGGFLLPGWLAAPIALFLVVPAMRLCGRFLAGLIPHDETDAVSQDELVGCRAVIVLGAARKNTPAQARIRDRFGTTHYLMVEPDNPGETLEQGKDLLLVRRDGALHYAIEHPQPDPEGE